MSVENQLAQAWQNIFDGSQQAIDWVSQVRPNVARLNNEADGLILELRRLRNTAKRLGAVSERPMTTGFFGLSQAGKSFLISALAADANGNLETLFDGRKLDFIKHVNPPGGGKEATGLVTRFSRTAKGGIQGYPLELRLFHEIEIAKLLVNSYFNDFDKEKVDYKLDQQNVNALLRRMTAKMSAQRVAGVTEDDVVDLQDYATESFGKSLAMLQGGYWAKATLIAPYLSINDRAQLFSILWGEEADLSAIYVQFAQTLAALGNADRVYAPLSAVVKEVNGELSQADSIMNVDMLERLNTDKDELLEVRPYFSEDNIGEPVKISLAQLTALTAELVFPLMNPTRVPAVESVDLLDFPGYRGRLAISSLKEIQEGNPVSQLILRGKVAYLFERYTDSQEMNLLIVCTPSDKQSDVNSVGPVLERWINKTQGDTPEARSQRKPGLLWAITMFDKRISADLSKDENMLKISWGSGGLLKQTILERFGNYPWLNDWSNGKPFNNTFLVRKPGFKVSFLDVEDGQELRVRPNESAQLDLLRRTFADDPDIQKHIANPQEAWDGMMLLNDGGMQRISDYLKTVAMPQVKQKRIAEQLNHAIQHIIENRFASWYQSDGAEEVQRKQQLAKLVIGELQKSALIVGEFLRSLQLPEETIHSLYFADNDDDLLSPSAKDSDEANKSNAFASGFGFDDGFDLFDEPQSAVKNPNVSEEKLPESRFAQAVFKAWIEHLRGISMDPRNTRFYPFSAQCIEGIVGELITGANRLNLLNRLTKVINRNEVGASKRDQIVERQVFSVTTEIADFLAWLGFDQMPVAERPASHVRDGQIFEIAEVEKINNLPKLSNYTGDYTKNYLADWFIAFMEFAQSNAGHSAGREIDAVQNARLGEILNVFRNSAVAE